MIYAIEILEKEMLLLEKCLTKWEKESYPAARKERNDKYKNLRKAIEYLKSNIIITFDCYNIDLPFYPDKCESQCNFCAAKKI